MRFPLLMVGLAAGTVLAGCEASTPLDTVAPNAPAFASSPAWPDVIPLTGMGPEGIAVGSGNTFYAGSLGATSLGRIVVGDLRTGEVAELVPASGLAVVGIKYDGRSNLLFAARGRTGYATVHDAETGAQLAMYPTGLAFINDVALTREAAYFTNSAPVAALYRIALAANGQPGVGSTVGLPANFASAGSCGVGPGLTANGIVATPDGKLIVAHMSEGTLYRVDPATAAGTAIALTGGDNAGGAPLCTTDGMWLSDGTLYVVQNFLHRIAVVAMAPDYLSGTITGYLTSPHFKVPTTIAEHGDALYAVNAGFGPGPYQVVRVAK